MKYCHTEATSVLATVLDKLTLSLPQFKILNITVCSTYRQASMKQNTVKIYGVGYRYKNIATQKM